MLVASLLSWQHTYVGVLHQWRGYSDATSILLLLTPATTAIDAAVAYRFQSQLPDQRRYHSVLPTLMTITREEGLNSLYKGFVPKALRLGIGQTVGLIMFERLLRVFGVHQDDLKHETIDDVKVLGD